jgi:hypothetical protein
MNSVESSAHRTNPKTVRNHVSNILGKLQVADRAEAIIRAGKPGWVPAETGTVCGRGRTGEQLQGPSPQVSRRFRF